LETLDRLIQAEVPISTIRNNIDHPKSRVRGTLSCSPDFVPDSFMNLNETTSTARKAFTHFQRALALIPTKQDVYDKWISRIQGMGDLLHFNKPEPWIPAIIVARGCEGFCTYCAIKQALGPLVSTPLESVIHQARILVKNERQPIVSLIAGDLGAYGQDIGSNICELLEVIFEIDAAFKLVLNDFNPEWLIKYSDRLLPILARYKHKVDHIKLPVQSGSDRVLHRMGRRYAKAELIEHIGALNREVPSLPISTHIMVGFPGESDEEFNQTVSLLDAMHFEYVTVFKYSDRPGTPSSAFPDKIPERTKRQRLRMLRKKLLAERRFSI
jgi:MiaB/RimO family radical SAM methylthiotransferase